MITPMRSDLLAPTALPLYTARGFDAGDTTAYLAAVNRTLSHPNLVPSPAMPGLTFLRQGRHGRRRAGGRGGAGGAALTRRSAVAVTTAGVTPPAHASRVPGRRSS